MVSADADATLHHPRDATLKELRQAVASIEKHWGFPEDPGMLKLGLPEVDAALGGGLVRAAVHELAPARPAQFGAAAGFTCAIMALAMAQRDARGRAALVIQTDFGVMETGGLYGPGLECLGLPMKSLILLRVPRPTDVLWAAEEALKSHAVAVVLAELPEDGAIADLTATRRLTLAARAGGGLGLLIRQRSSPLATSATTRWDISAFPSVPDRYGGLGRTAFALSLNRNRHGRCGRFIARWDHHECVFLPPLSLRLAAAACDGSAQPRPLAQAC